MNTAKNVAILIMLGAVILGAQNQGLSVQTPQSPLTAAPVPAAGMNTVFSGPDGWYVASGIGSLVKLGAGTPGPIGPQGVKGDTGLTGPQGPAGTLAGPICVTLTGDTKTNLILTPVTCK